MPNALRRVVLSVLFMCALATVGTSTAVASSHKQHVQSKPAVHLNLNKKQKKLCRQATDLRKAVVKKYNKRKPGRDICRYGTRGGSVPSIHKLEDYKSTLWRMKNPPPPPPPAPAPVAASPPQPAVSSTTATTSSTTSSPTATTASSSSSSASPTLEAIAQCESGGDPTTNTGNGFYGKYQFTQSTWESVGGTGLPSNAPEGVQDALAAKLYAQQGAAPWPVCGR